MVGETQGREVLVGFSSLVFYSITYLFGGGVSPTNSWCLRYLIVLHPHQTGDSLKVRAAVMGFREGLPPRYLTL